MVPRSYLTVEVKPHSKSSTSSSTSTPTLSSPPSSPGKSVRFVNCIKSESRALEHVEQWSLYNFESHARRCVTCLDPAQLASRGKQLCSTGYALALDVAQHIHLVDGHPCSTRKQNHKHVRVEIPSDYTQVQQLLYSRDSFLRRKSRTSSHSEEHRPVLGRRRSPDQFVDLPTTVVVEPRSPLSPRSSHKHSRHRTPTPDSSTEHSPSGGHRHGRSDHRGSVYESNDVSPQRAYRVEVVEPARKSSKRDREARVSGLWL